MKNKSPERFSFHELKSMMGSIKAENAPVRFIGKDLAMLGEGHKALQKILQPDTPYIMEDCRMGFVRQGKIRLTVNLIEREYGEGTFAFISSGSILQINRMSDDFDLCGMMIGDERLKAALGLSVPKWRRGVVFHRASASGRSLNHNADVRYGVGTHKQEKLPRRDA